MLSFIRSIGCLLFRGCFTIEVIGDTIRTSVSVRYIVGVCQSWVVVKRGSTVVARYIVNLFRQDVNAI